MKNTLENKENAIQYLYGELIDAERDSFEEKLFTDEDFSLFVDNVENDLIDEYVRGELTFEEKREFEKKYLTTESRHERVALARTLQDKLFSENKVAVVATEETGIWQSLAGFFRMPNLAMVSGLAALLLFVLIGGVWLVSQSGGNKNIAKDNNNSQDNITPIKENLPQENPTPNPAETPKEQPENNANKSQENISDVNKNQSANSQKSNTNKPKVKPTPKPVEKKPKETKKPQKVVRKPSVFVASLFPPLRSSQNPVLKIPASTKTIRLQLFDTFEQKYQKFVVELNSSTGKTILTRELNASKKRPQKSIGISVSEKVLKQGTYEIAVKGVTKDGNVEEINYYNFTVQKIENKKE